MLKHEEMAAVLASHLRLEPISDNVLYHRVKCARTTEFTAAA